MMKLKEFNSIVIMILLSAVCFGQNKITGLVLDGKNQQPIKGAEVFNITEGGFVTTNKAGAFDFTTTKESLVLLIVAPEFDLFQEPIKTSNEVQTFNLKQQSINLDAVVVRNREELVFRLRRLADVEGTEIYAGKKNEVVKVDQIIANKATNNARQIYAQVVGLNIYEDCSGGLQLNVGGRGLNPNRSANFNIRQNGYDISADVLGYPESYYTPPAEAINEIQVIRGAASLQYGSQFGGLINFKLKQPAKQNIEVLTRQSVASFGTFTSFNQLSGTLGDFSYLAYANYKNGSCFRPNSDYESINAYVQTNYEISEKTKIGLELTYLNSTSQQPGGLTDVQFYQDPTSSNRDRNYFDVNWQLANFNLEHKVSKKARLSWKLSGLQAERKALGFRTNRVSQVDDVEQPRDLIDGEFNNWNTEFRYIQDYELGAKKLTSLVGAKYYHSNNSSRQGAGNNGSEDDFSFQNEKFPGYPYQSNFEFPNRNLALFSETIIRFSDKVSFTPGIRYETIKTESDGSYQRVFTNLAGDIISNIEREDNRVFDRNFVLLGGGLSYKPSTTNELYTNFSQNYRSVTFNDIRVNNPTYQIDPNIEDEKGFTADLGFRGTVSNKLSFDVGAYALRYDKRLGEILKAETRINASGEEVETGRLIRFRGNIGEAYMYGFEGFGEWNLTNTFKPKNEKLYASVFLNTAFTNSEYVKSEENNVKGNEVEFIPDVNLKTGLRFGYENLLGSFQFSHIGEQYTDATNAEQDLNDSQRGIEGSIPTYQVADLSLSYKFRNFKVETGVNNLFDESYFTRRATGYPGPGIIPSDKRNYYFTIQAKF